MQMYANPPIPQNFFILFFLRSDEMDKQEANRWFNFTSFPLDNHGHITRKLEKLLRRGVACWAGHKKRSGFLPTFHQ